MLKPTHDNVLLKKINDGERRTEGGVLLPDIAKQKVMRCRVIAVGPGWYAANGQRIPTEVKQGCIAYLPHGVGIEVEEDGEKYIVTGSRDVLAFKSSESAE